MNVLLRERTQLDVKEKRDSIALFGKELLS